MEVRDWRSHNARSAELLRQRTGADVATWKARIQAAGLSDETGLRAWLDQQGVTGYPQSLLVMEQFGYPDFLVASADELVANQYQDRSELRPILDALLAQAAMLGPVTIQTRKSFVALLTPRRTFAIVQATTKRRVDLGLRLDGVTSAGRLVPATSMGSSSVTHRIGLSYLEEVDDEVEHWLRRAYEESA